MNKRAFGILLGWACSIPGFAQQVETDYSKYLSPIVFVLPKAPEQSASSPTQKYVAKINIAADGGVVLPVELDPPDPAMVTSVNEAARFWVFAPGLTTDCAPGPRSGRIGLEYDTQAGRAWVELPQLEGAKTTRPKFTIATQAASISYPRYETTRGISEGRVTVAMKLMADGSTSGHAIFFAVPRSRGFIETALKASKQISVKFNEPLDKPFACTLITYAFKLE